MSSNTPVTALTDVTNNPTAREAFDRASGLVERARTLTVKDEATLDAANHMLVELKQASNEVERVRALFVKPLREYLRAVEGFFKKASDPLETADRALRASAMKYRNELEAQVELTRRKLARAALEAARQAEETRAKALMESGATKEEMLASADALELKAQAAAVSIDEVQGAPKSMSAGEGRVTGFARWTFEVTDAELVPREYLRVDEQAIRRSVQAGLREIPGVRIFQTQALQVRR